MDSEKRLYKLDKQPDGRYRVASWDREYEGWFPLSASDRRSTAIQQLEALRLSANADPLVVCPECNAPIAWPLDHTLNFCGADGLHYCSPACESAHITGVPLTGTTHKFSPADFFLGVLAGALVWILISSIGGAA